MLTKRVLISLLVLAGAAGGVAAADRDLLWGVVKLCVANHELTGGAFPCLDVDTTQGVARGFAVIRATEAYPVRARSDLLTVNWTVFG